VLLALFLSGQIHAQEKKIKGLTAPLFQSKIEGQKATETLKLELENSRLTKKDSILPSLVSNGRISGPIKYKAKDFVKISQLENKIALNNEAEILYEDTELTAGVIDIDYLTSEVQAGRITNDKGEKEQTPNFTQGPSVVIPDSIRFNFNTQKALIYNSRTEQGASLGAMGGGEAMKVFTEFTKKENDSVFFFKDGKLTTAKDTIDPDYYIKIRKAKFVPGKKIIAGFANMYLEDVPTPIALPFAYFPLTTGRTGGLIFPTITNDPQRGYALQNGGYYLPLSEYADLNIMGDFYTNGSYGMRLQSVYTKRYKYRGNVNFRFENLVNSQKGFDDYSRSTIFNLQISHSQDAKASPNSRFSASVNIGSSSYFRNSANQQNLALTQNNNLSSSVSYSKTFPAYPSVNLSLTATHNQNTNTQAINMTLPTMQANMERIFPFAKRNGIKKGIIQNINLQYSMRAENRIRTTDSLFLTARMFEDAKFGARHSIPISTNFKVAKYLSVSAGASYEDVWTFETFRRGQDPNAEFNKEIVLDTVRGFERYNNYGISSSVGTTLYGTYTFKENSKFEAIRHVMRPSVSWSYKPSFEQYYDYYERYDGALEQFSVFEGSLYGAPSLRRTNSLSFALQNTLEAKVRPKDSTETESKKVSLLSNLNFSSSYNMEADSLRISPVTFNGATALFDKKMSINFTGALDPYALDANNRKINKLNVKNNGSLFRLTRFSVNVGYSLDNKTFDKNARKDDEQESEDRNGENYNEDYRAASGGRDDDLFGFGLNDGGFDDQNRTRETPEGEEEEEEESELYRNPLPWTMRLAFTSNYSNNARQNEFTNTSLMFSGTVDLTPKWKVRFSSGYDFKNKGFNLTQLGFKRELKSFDLRFNWVPFGRNQRWDFFIGINSSMLSDLKWESRSQRNTSFRR